MNFGFTEDQELLRSAAREFLSRESPMAYVRRMMEDVRGFEDAQWRKMAELGWLGLAIPEGHGGAGLGFVDLVVLLEEMGRVVLPGPFFATAVLAAPTLVDAASPALQAEWLPKIAAGRARGTLALLERSARWDAAGIALEARPEGGGYRLSGTKLFVPDAHTADFLLVATRAPGSSGSDGLSVLLVDAADPGVRATPVQTMDQTRKLCAVELRDVAVPRSRVVGEPGQGAAILDRIATRARAGLAAEMCGGAARVLDLSVEYAKVREQFGRPIGSFQAIQHKCATMLVEVESARSATYYAAWAVGDGAPDGPLAAAMAKAYASDAFRHVAAEGIQIHGGIGFTWEHDMHVYFKRAKGSEVGFGDAAWNREIVARLIGL
jgi:alkylation response protein AidB-like acyl-CoA dehydrogenase